MVSILLLKNWNIIIFTETNGNTSQSQYWKTINYKSWWSHTNNNLGQGVEVSLISQLAQKVFKIHKQVGQILLLDLSFLRKCFEEIIGIYYPANSNT